MNYSLVVENGYIVGTCKSDYPLPNSVTEQEANAVQQMFLSKPTPQAGYDYKLKADTLTWELVELPPIDDTADEATESDYITALQDLGVEVDA